MKIGQNVNARVEKWPFSKIPFEYRKNTQSQRVVPHSRKLSLLDLSWSIGLMPEMCSPLILIYQTLEGG
jgi:hypothetical protein